MKRTVFYLAIGLMLTACGASSYEKGGRLAEKYNVLYE